MMRVSIAALALVSLGLLQPAPSSVRFEDITAQAGIGAGPLPTSCAWADVDRDGFVDLFVTNYVDARPETNVVCGVTASNARMYCHPLNFKPLASTLYHNNRNGTFTDVSARAA